MATARLFLALWPGPRVRPALAAVRDRAAWPAGAAPTPDDKLHVTLHFIGAVPADRVAAIGAGLAVPMRPFVLQLDRATAWRGGLAVLQPGELPPRLAELHQALAVALRALALPVETRPFRPHVTLARHAPGVQLPAPEPALRWSVRGYVLVESVQGRYRVLRRYPASPRDGAGGA